MGPVEIHVSLPTNISWTIISFLLRGTGGAMVCVSIFYIRAIRVLARVASPRVDVLARAIY